MNEVLEIGLMLSQVQKMCNAYKFYKFNATAGDEELI